MAFEKGQYLTFPLPEELENISIKDITYRCWLHANKMTEEGHHVTANILLAAMEEILKCRKEKDRAEEIGWEEYMGEGL